MSRLTLLMAVVVMGAVWCPAWGQPAADARVPGAEEARPKPRKSVRKPERPAAPAKEPTLTAAGGFESSIEKARASALNAAGEKLRDYFRSQYGIDRELRPEQIRRLVLPEQETVVEEPIVSDLGTTETMYRVTLALHVDGKAVRELRTQQRAAEALGWIAGLAVLFGIVAVFFKIDAWTKGYLTSWLVLGTVAALSLVVGLWLFAR